MPRKVEPMSAFQVKNLKPKINEVTGEEVCNPVAVGGISGLILQVGPGKARSWVLRTSIGRKRQKIGLGSYPEVSLTAAKVAASEIKAQIRAGINPLEERRARKLAVKREQDRKLSFQRAAEMYMEVKKHELSPRSERQWRESLKNYINPVIGSLSVKDIGLFEVKRVLDPIWNAVPETAGRVRGRIEKILSWAAVHGYRDKNEMNPASLKGNLDSVYAQLSKVKRAVGAGKNFPAMPYQKLPEFMKKLRTMSGTKFRALEFLILTAVRTGEVIGDKRIGKDGVTWKEIDLEAGIWNIPAERMKMDKDHTVVLNADAKALLMTMNPGGPDDLIFPSPKGGVPTDAFLRSALAGTVESFGNSESSFYDQKLGRMPTPHGFRACFKQWSMEQTGHDQSLVELALAHTEKNQVVAAYARNPAQIAKRQVLMDDWQKYLYG